MRDTVAAAVARTLGISSKLISGWSLEARQDGRRGAPGMLTTHLQVKVEADRDTLYRLQIGQHRGSWALNSVYADSARPFDVAARLDVVLLYGKETQHIFKSLAQMTTYRRNQKGRRR
jgi:hypothetical protein